MVEAVLDASAVLAVLQVEPGGARVAEVLSYALLSSVNASEVVAKMIRSGAAAAELAVKTVRLLECQIVSVDDELGLRAGALYAQTARFGLSLADRICLALAERERLPVLTADRAWASLDIGVEIRLIR